MNKFVVSVIAVAFMVMATGCAASQQCLRDNAALTAQNHQQQQELADVNGKLAIVATEKTGGNLSQLAKDGWLAASASFHWVTNEAPVAYRQGKEAYNGASDRLAAAQKCYHDNGGGREGLTVDDYKRIAMACLSSN